MTVPSREDAALVNKRTWPQLSLVVVQDDVPLGATSDRDLALVHVAGMPNNNRAEIRVLQPLHTTALESGNLGS